MKPQYENQLMASVLLWLDNKVLTKGEAFFNYSGLLYRLPSDTYISGTTTYKAFGAPYKPIVADSAISTSAIVPARIYVSGQNGNQPVTGNFSYREGQFHTDLTGTLVISGHLSVKEFNINLTNKTDAELLFETKYVPRPKIPVVPSGLGKNVITYPAVFLINNGGKSEEFAFGGMETTISNVRAVVIADNTFNLDAICSIMKDQARGCIPLLAGDEYPYNSFGFTKSATGFNYNNLVGDRVSYDSGAFIKNVMVTRLDSNARIMSEVRDINPEIFPAFVDFTLEKARYPRS